MFLEGYISENRFVDLRKLIIEIFLFAFFLSSSSSIDLDDNVKLLKWFLRSFRNLGQFFRICSIVYRQLHCAQIGT